ncbi:M24 family metallopeptidase [Aliamphritea spongicola]|uniref:M24 family metallopeptidase n=1 Tax=Aliamphritea spongicola TaxID=707589 RepID=UPI00196BA560|nr:Xaa-Pro peptidase family protein [Aliamphritea spongicola]MBN3561180.1 aminopeptidase P family protein [Aliamphritea spongicola]
MAGSAISTNGDYPVEENLVLSSIPDKQLAEMHSYRLERIRQQMRLQDVSLCVLASPVSLRYAVNFVEYQMFQAHIPTAYLFIPLEGPVTLFGASQRHYSLVDDYCPSRFVTPFDGGVDLTENCRQLVADIGVFMDKHRLCDGVLALERLSPLISQQLVHEGFQLADAECLVEQARMIKHPVELACIEQSVAVAEYGIAQMQQALRPGITENQLWSVLHQVNIAHGGDWIEGKMLASGPRTNPWLQEATNRVIQSGELVAFDTDMIGPHGYLADISRTWLCGDLPPSTEQKDAYRHAWEEIQYNTELIRPGVGFNELAELAFARQQQYRARRYVCAFHGAGLSDEYPKIYYPEDSRHNTYDDVLQENMVMCVESYSGADNGCEGVKLEQMVRVTKDGCETISRYPFEEVLLS